jgi:hypothetical protein
MTMHSAVDDAFYKLAFSKVDYKWKWLK